MKLIERFLAAICLLAYALRETTGYLDAGNAIMIVGTLLGLLYLFGSWWVLKPSTRSIRTLSIAILYGLASWSMAFTILFKMLYLLGSDEMAIMSYVLLGMAVLFDLAASIRSQKVLNWCMTVRLIVLTVLVTTFYNIPEDTRIYYTFRHYPQFLEFYELNRGKLPFYLLQQRYFDSQPVPSIRFEV